MTAALIALEGESHCIACNRRCLGLFAEQQQTRSEQANHKLGMSCILGLAVYQLTIAHPTKHHDCLRCSILHATYT
jgi:hypothetical protein